MPLSVMQQVMLSPTQTLAILQGGPELVQDRSRRRIHFAFVSKNNNLDLFAKFKQGSAQPDKKRVALTIYLDDFDEYG